MDLWHNFAKTGNVYDYLKYKQDEENIKADISNASNNQGLDYKRTDDRRE